MLEYATMHPENYNPERYYSSSPLSNAPDLVEDQEEESRLQLNRYILYISCATLQMGVSRVPRVCNTIIVYYMTPSPTPPDRIRVMAQCTMMNERLRTCAWVFDFMIQIIE